MDGVHRAFQRSVTHAVAVLFRVGVGIVALAFVITALMPSVELRHGHGRAVTRS